MAKGIAISGGGAVLRGKVGAFAASFFVGDTQLCTILFPEPAMAGLFAVNISQGMRYFMQQGMPDELWRLLQKAGNKVARKGYASFRVMATTQATHGAVPPEAPVGQPCGLHTSFGKNLHGIGGGETELVGFRHGAY